MAADKIRVLGIGPGTSQWLPPAIKAVVKDCQVLIGGSRGLAMFPDFVGSTYQISGQLHETMEVLQDVVEEEKRVGVLVSGDPGLYSLLPLLKKSFPSDIITVYPGISSMQHAFAKAGMPWQEAEIISVHGRPLESLPLNISKPLGVFTGGKNTPQKIAAYYLTYGFNPLMYVGDALTYPEERWVKSYAQELAKEASNFSNAVLLICPGGETVGDGQVDHGQYAGFGRDDHEFIRGNVPMTKSEIRVQVLAKGKITPNSRVLDVGAGTGSLSIEAALLAQRGCVYAVEKDVEAQELILQNCQKFRVNNLQLVRGTAPEVLERIPIMDVCLIGGSQGRLEEILRVAPLRPGGRVVITAVTLETLAAGLQALKTLEYEEVDVVSIQAVRWKGIKNFHMAQAQNPVFILSGQKKAAD